jgi:hypothetical protein
MNVIMNHLLPTLVFVDYLPLTKVLFTTCHYQVINFVFMFKTSTQYHNTTLNNKMLYEAWTGKQPNIKNLQMFGEIGYVHLPLETCKKWTKKYHPCHLLGYVPQLRNYTLWDPN